MVAIGGGRCLGAQPCLRRGEREGEKEREKINEKERENGEENDDGGGSWVVVVPARRGWVLRRSLVLGSTG